MTSVTCPNCNSRHQIHDEARAFRCPTCAADVRYYEQAPMRPPPPGWQPGWYAGQGTASATGTSPQTAGKAEKPIWKRAWVWVVGIILLLIVVSLAASPDTGTRSGAATDTTAQTGGGGADGGSGGGSGTGGGSGDSAEIAEAASDGQFTFTVTDFKCGDKKVGRGFLAVKAQGEFCIADITVENTGDEAALLDSSSQYAFIDGKKYEASGEVFAATKKAEAFFLENINPGNSVQGIVVWDVPTGQQPERLELHDSPFSGGVDVRL